MAYQRSGGQLQTVLGYEYSTGNLIGHGAFALVFKGRRKQVGIYRYSHNVLRYGMQLWQWEEIVLNLASNRGVDNKHVMVKH